MKAELLKLSDADLRKAIEDHEVSLSPIAKDGEGEAYEKCLREHNMECGVCLQSGEFVPC